MATGYPIPSDSYFKDLASRSSLSTFSLIDREWLEIPFTSNEIKQVVWYNGSVDLPDCLALMGILSSLSDIFGKYSEET